MIRPIHTLFFALTVFFCIGVISLCTRSEKTITFAVFTLRIPKFHLLHQEKPPVYKDISRIVNFGSTLDNPDIAGVKKHAIATRANKKGVTIALHDPDNVRRDRSGTVTNADLSKGINVLPGSKLIRKGDAKCDPSRNSGNLTSGSLQGVNETSGTNADISSRYDELLRHIEYPDGIDTLLYPLFRQLYALGRTKELIHILHYGDSQIEGDRVSSYLRTQFQRRFGGSGVGMMPIVANGPASLPYTYEVSSGWERFCVQDKIKKSDSNLYGIYLSYYKLKPDITNGESSFSGWINLKWPNNGNPLIQRFTTCKVYFGNVTAAFDVDLVKNDSIISHETVVPDSKSSSVTWKFARSEKDLYIKFKGSESPDFYGISLTGSSGIALDNIPLRGSSGLEFTSADKELLSMYFRTLHTKLLILQFGVNVVPNITTNYSSYEKSFSNQLRYLKSLIPDLQIIVMGVNDAAEQTENGIESFPNVEKIRDAQKAAAFANGCVFWDTFEAMGGRNSMYSWVNATPPLAQKDFKHLTSDGARIIGELLFRAVIAEYNKFVILDKGMKS